MDKEQETNIENNENSQQETGSTKDIEINNQVDQDSTSVQKEITPDERIKELEDKLTRAFAEMENQRRRFEKEKEDAFEYGGYSFAKEAVNLIDNLDRSKHVLENDENLKDSNALKKTLEHLEIISKDLSASMGSTVKFDYKVDKELIGGLKLQLGSFMVDTSIKNKLKKYEQQMIEN